MVVVVEAWILAVRYEGMTSCDEEVWLEVVQHVLVVVVMM